MKSEKIMTGRYKKIFVTVCVICFCILSFLVIQIAKPNRVYTFPIEQTVVLSGNERMVLCEGIGLPMGIYKVQVSYQTEDDFGYSVSLTDETKAPLRVMQNSQMLAASHTSETFHLWLLEKTDQLTLFLQGDSGQEITFDTLCITKTDQFWYCITFAMVVLGILVLACIWFAAYHYVHKIPKEDFVVAGVIVLLTVLLSRPFLMNWICLTGDVGYHLERIDGVARSIVDGVFPMRLEPNFPFGYGYADGVLYGSTLLYIPAILWLIGFPVLYCYNLFIILINFATITVAFYCFYKMFRDKWIGLMCSALYAFSLYRITVLYGRGCLGEGSAQIFLPLLLYGYFRLFTEDRKEKKYRNIWFILLLGYSGVLQTHTLTCELALIWTCVICLVNIKKVFRKETLKELIKGAGASFLCNAWYAIPFLDYYISEDFLIKNLGKQMIQYQGISLKLVFTHFFDGVLVSEEGLPIRAVGPGLIPMLALFAFVGISIYCSVQGKESKLLSAARACAVLAFVCIAFSLKIFPWDWIQQLSPLTERIVSSFLIPTRFLNWGTLFMVPVFGYCLWYAKNESRWRKLAYSIGTAAVFLAVGTSSMYFIYQVTHTYDKAQVFDNNLIVGYVSGGEYVIYGTDTSGLTYGVPQVSETVQVLQYEKGDLSAKLRCVNYSQTEEGYVEVPLFLYKGYHAYAGSGEELQCVYGDNNVIRVILPSGFEDNVSVRFVSPVLWRVSEIISLLAWIGILVYGIYWVKSKKNVNISCN